MVLLDELRVTMSDYRKDLKELYEVLGIEKAQARYDELQKQVADPDFYSDLENSQKVLQEVKSLENRINKYKKMEETLDDILTLIELTMEEGEEESNAELNEEADSFVKELESLKLASLLTGEYDSSNAIPDVQPLGRAPQLQGRTAGLSGRRRGWLEECVHHDLRRQRLRLFEVRVRRASSGTCVSV